jgi:hypothetical protein
MAHPMHLGEVPPTYKIDLSLPPAERYVHVARDYRDQLISITRLFDRLATDAASHYILAMGQKIVAPSLATTVFS